jgi:hypothetical protein
VVLTDVVMPGLGGEAVLAGAQERVPDVPVILMTAFGSIDAAVRMVRAGAFDYVTKPVGTAELLKAIERAVRQSRTSRDESTASAAASALGVSRVSEGLRARVFGGLVAESKSMQSLLALVERVAASPHPVLLTGESGSGRRCRPRDPCVAAEVRCGELWRVPEPLIGVGSSGTNAAPSPERSRRRGSWRRRGGRSSRTRSASCRWRCSRHCCDSRERRATKSVFTESRRMTCGSSPPRRDLEDETRAGRSRRSLLAAERPPLRWRHCASVADVLPLARKFIVNGSAHTDPARKRC